MSALLDVRDLEVTLSSTAGPVHAVRGASFSVGVGERVGLVGESGSGKSVAALSLLGLLERSARVGGQAWFGGADLLTLGGRERRAVRGARIGLVLQNALGALDPAMTIGAQLAEAVRAHRRVRRSDCRRAALDLLATAGMPDPERAAGEHAHRLSGGMRQRALIAIALAGEPELLIADESTTALDVSVQSQVLDLLTRLSHERGMAVLLITHDLAVLARFADRVVVMYAGQVMEQGPLDAIYAHAAHPYTWGLMGSLTRLDRPPGDRLHAIPGAPPSAMHPPPGCPFAPRCAHARDRCQASVPALQARPAPGHSCACVRADELVNATATETRP